MPVEKRTIIFSRDEIAQALAAHGQANGRDLVQDRIMLCHVTEDPELQVTVKLVPAGRSEVETITLDPEAVGKALIRHCLSLNIPIPTHATRSLQAMGDNIAMLFSINEKSHALPAFV